MSPFQLVKLFDNHVSGEFQRKTLQLLCDTYEQTWADVSKLHKYPESTYLWGHQRRACFERDWRLLANECNGVESRVADNQSCNFAYTEITSGNVIMTASTVDEQFQFVRKAEYRRTSARSSQIPLFPDDRQPVGEKLYAILIHSPGRGKQGEHPSLAKFVFPLPSGGRHSAEIDLLQRFEIGITRRGIADEIIPDTVHPSLMKKSNAIGAG